MTWFYNNARVAWFHAAGVRSDNPPDKMPSGAETAILLAEHAKNNPEREYQPGSVMNKPEGCGCAEGFRRE